jgi:DNA-binding transcriptional LysR family regulator
MNRVHNCAMPDRHQPKARTPGVSRAPINLASVDLNLLTAFDAMMKTGNVTRAAEQVRRSQSAMSHALGRLRRLFGDELFVRERNRYVPTAKAQELAELVEPALASLCLAFEGRVRFDPATAHRHFAIGTPDVGSFAFLPMLMPTLRTAAPHVSLSVVDVNTIASVSALAAGQIELAIGYFPEMPPMMAGHHLVTLHSVGLADRNNPRLRDGKMDIATFLAAPHVSNTPANDPAGSDMDRLLNTLSAQRSVVLRLPHYLAIPAAIRGTDLVAVVERALLSRMPDRDGLVAFELPLPQPSTGVALIWHQRHNGDPGHRWMRQLIVDAAERSLGPAGAGAHAAVHEGSDGAGASR